MIRVSAISSSRRLGLCRCSELSNPFAGLGFSPDLDERFGQVEVHGVPTGVGRVVLEQRQEAIDRTGVPALPIVEKADAIVCFILPIACLTKPVFDLG